MVINEYVLGYDTFYNLFSGYTENTRWRGSSLLTAVAVFCNLCVLFTGSVPIRDKYNASVFVTKSLTILFPNKSFECFFRQCVCVKIYNQLIFLILTSHISFYSFVVYKRKHPEVRTDY